MKRTFLKNPKIVLRRIHNSFFLIDISDNYSNDSCSLFEINQIGAFIWDHIDGKRSADALTDIVVDAIVDDVDRQIIFDDVCEFVESLISRNFVEECKNG